MSKYISIWKNIYTEIICENKWITIDYDSTDRFTKVGNLSEWLALAPKGANQFIGQSIPSTSHVVLCSSCSMPEPTLKHFPVIYKTIRNSKILCLINLLSPDIIQNFTNHNYQGNYRNDVYNPILKKLLGKTFVSSYLVLRYSAVSGYKNFD